MEQRFLYAFRMTNFSSFYKWNEQRAPQSKTGLRRSFVFLQICSFGVSYLNGYTE